MTLALGLVGVMALFLGLMKVAEAGGLLVIIARLVRPMMIRLFPDVPADHPAMGAMILNLSANVLGLDNAATPLGIKAMQDLQTLNPRPDTASNAQILFLVLNTSAVTVFPMAILLYRAQMGAPDPAVVFLPILLATSCSTLVGLLVTAWVQRIRLWDTVILAWLGGLGAALLALLAWFATLSAAELQARSSLQWIRRTTTMGFRRSVRPARPTAGGAILRWSLRCSASRHPSMKTGPRSSPVRRRCDTSRSPRPPRRQRTFVLRRLLPQWHVRRSAPRHHRPRR